MQHVNADGSVAHEVALGSLEAACRSYTDNAVASLTAQLQALQTQVGSYINATIDREEELATQLLTAIDTSYDNALTNSVSAANAYTDDRLQDFASETDVTQLQQVRDFCASSWPNLTLPVKAHSLVFNINPLVFPPGLAAC